MFSTSVLESKKPEEKPDDTASEESVTELTAAVTEAENKYQESDYTEEDWKVFADAVKEWYLFSTSVTAAVSSVTDSGVAGASGSSGSSGRVSTAIGITWPSNVKSSKVIDSKVFADAVKEAKEVIGNKNATQKQVDDAKKKLEDAVNLLESKKPEEKDPR